MADVQKWSLKGQWFDVCRCAIPCPCSWAQPPDDGFCEGILIWHIQEGRYGNVKLDGLNVAMLGSFRGNVWEKASDFKDAIFMDERADEPQRAALQSVFSGQAGGWPKRFGEMVKGETMGFAFAPIKVEIAADLSKWRRRDSGPQHPGRSRSADGPDQRRQGNENLQPAGRGNRPRRRRHLGPRDGRSRGRVRFQVGPHRQVQQAHRL